MAILLKGVTVKWGVAGTVTNLLVQSITVDKTYEVNDRAMDEEGRTATLLYNNPQRECVIEGIAKTADMPELGAALTITTQTDVGVSSTVTGVVESVSEKGVNKDFTRISIKVRQLDSIASYV